MPNEPIHSGHFMTSNPHTEKLEDEDEDVEVLKLLKKVYINF